MIAGLQHLSLLLKLATSRMQRFALECPNTVPRCRKHPFPTSIRCTSRSFSNKWLSFILTALETVIRSSRTTPKIELTATTLSTTSYSFRWLSNSMRGNIRLASGFQTNRTMNLVETLLQSESALKVEAWQRTWVMSCMQWLIGKALQTSESAGHLWSWTSIRFSFPRRSIVIAKARL